MNLQNEQRSREDIEERDMDMEATQNFFNAADAFAIVNGMTITEVRDAYARADSNVQV